jgi:hypothetical protein
LTETELAPFINDFINASTHELPFAYRDELGSAIAVGAATVDVCDVTVAKTLNPISSTVDVAFPASVIVHTFSR